MSVDRSKLNPIVNNIIDSILSVKDDIPEEMVLSMVNYCLAEVTCMTKRLSLLIIMLMFLHQVQRVRIYP